MVSFQTAEIYNQDQDNIIGVKVTVSADQGQVIDEIQVTNKTEFEALVARLDELGDEFVQFADGSSMSGMTIDQILANVSETLNINATTLNGIQSDGYAKTSHTHQKSQILNLYNYDITLSKYNLNVGTNSSTDKTTTVSVKVTNMNNAPVTGHNVIIYLNGEVWRTGTTNNQGVFSSNYVANEEGIVTFQINNQKVQAYVKYDTGWVNITSFGSIFKNDTPPLQIRRVGKNVQIIGAARSKTSHSITAWTDLLNLCELPDNRFVPSIYQTFGIRLSRANSAVLRINQSSVGVMQFSGASSSGSYTLPENMWFAIYVSYLVD